MRQPQPFVGVIAIIPSEMIHLPSGGWTTKAGSVVNELTSPERKRSFAPSGHAAS